MVSSQVNVAGFNGAVISTVASTSLGSAVGVILMMNVSVLGPPVAARGGGGGVGEYPRGGFGGDGGRVWVLRNVVGTRGRRVEVGADRVDSLIGDILKLRETVSRRRESM